MLDRLIHAKNAKKIDNSRTIVPPELACKFSLRQLRHQTKWQTEVPGGLPQEIWTLIFSYIFYNSNKQDFGQLAMACKFFYYLFHQLNKVDYNYKLLKNDNLLALQEYAHTFAVISDNKIAINYQNKIGIFAVITGQCSQTISLNQAKREVINFMKVIPNSNKIVFSMTGAYRENILFIWDMHKNRLKTFTIKNIEKIFCCTPLSSEKILIGCHDQYNHVKNYGKKNALHLLDLATNKFVNLNLDGMVYDIAVFSEDSVVVFHCSFDLKFTLSIIDITTGEYKKELLTNKWLYAMTVLPDGRIAAISYRSADINLFTFDPITYECKQQKLAVSPHLQLVDLLLPLSNTHVATVYNDMRLSIWDIATGDCTKEISLNKGSTYYKTRAMTAYKGAIICLNSDENHLDCFYNSDDKAAAGSVDKDEHGRDIWVTNQKGLQYFQPEMPIMIYEKAFLRTLTFFKMGDKDAQETQVNSKEEIKLPMNNG